MGSMSAYKRDKLKKLLAEYRPNTVCLASWLEEKGISRDLQKYYLKSGWFEAVGRGAYKRAGDKVDWEGALYALQEQAGLQVHVGGLTALTKQGSNQYLRLGIPTIYLYSPLGVKLPSWFTNREWYAEIKHVKTGFLPEGLGVESVKAMSYSSMASPFDLKISNPERAIVECLYLAPKEFDLVEIYEIMDGLVNLRPKQVQSLLEKCGSVKVKRLFLYMAEKAGHKWLPFVERQNIDLGTGDRAITPNGVYVADYRISIPKELVEK